MRFAGAPVGYRPRQPALAAGAAEDRLDIGAVAIDIRHHDDNIARGEFGILFQHRQQPIVQHLNLALRAVTDMNRQAAVVRGQQPLAAAVGKLLGAATGHRRIAQLKDIRLQIMQQVIRRDIDKGVQLFIALKTRQQINIVAPQLAPGGQQRITHILLPGVVEQPRSLFRIAKQRQRPRRFAVVAPLAGQQLREKCRVFNVAPVIATRVGEEDIDVDMLTQRL